MVLQAASVKYASLYRDIFIEFSKGLGMLKNLEDSPSINSFLFLLRPDLDPNPKKKKNPFSSLS